MQNEARIHLLQTQFAQNADRKSERRKVVQDCSANADCSAAIADLEVAGEVIRADLASAMRERERLTDQP